MDDYNEYRKKKKRTVITVVLVVACCAMAFCFGMLVYRCSHKNDATKYVDRYVLFTDETTGEVYEATNANNWIKVSVPYTGAVHIFSHQVFAKKGKKALSNVIKHQNTVIQAPGTYYVKADHALEGGAYRREYTLEFTIEDPIKLQPEMRFDPNGALEYEDGLYYKYRYTGDKCYPIAYGWYEGERLDADRDPRYLVDVCRNEEGISVSGPREIGVYSVEFYIAYYASAEHINKYYAGLSKTVKIEIVS